MNRVLYLFLLFTVSDFAIAQHTDTTKNDRTSIHFQTTVINQYKPGFNAKYTGDNSLLTKEESATSITGTLFMGTRLWKGAQVFINPEIAGGSGLSSVLGIADATNGETFRIGDPAPKIYLARLFFTQVFSLSKDNEYQETDLNQIGGYIPKKYISFTIGKIGVADYFDNNKYSHDSRTQFMSWGLMDNGAWDYPANTRGYTPSFVAEYVSPKHEIRYGLSMVPKVANGNDINGDIFQACSQTIEYTHKHTIHNREGAIRILGFYTNANMGNYKEATMQASPAIESTRSFGRTKFGFGINAEQDISSSLGCFLRAGWNDGKNETWTFTEIDRSISMGLVMDGKKWKREDDNVGIAYVVSGISNAHKNYLAAGGHGFMLGDGALNYGYEHLTELYYSAELLKKNLFLTAAYQFIVNPGYNKDRHGPVNVFSIRLHSTI